MAAKKKLVGITTKSSTGALHTKFQSSSSSSSSSSDTSSSSSSSSDEDARKQNIKGKGAVISKGESQWDKKGSGSAHNIVAKTSVRGRNSMRGRGSGRGNKSTRGRMKNWNCSPDMVVGGTGDVLTTKSTLYTRGRGRMNKDNTRENRMQIVNDVQESLQEGLGMTKTPVVANDDNLLEPAVEEPTPDYSACPNLNGPPRQGDNLAFKVRI